MCSWSIAQTGLDCKYRRMTNSTAHAAAFPEVLTVDEAAKVLRISRQSAYQAVRAGEIPTVRIGRRLLVPRAQLEQMLGVTQEG
jgi:excisionase family DNA binding protein